MLPVYVINLDRRPDRWAAMVEQLDRLGIAAERVPAVDAGDVDGEIPAGLSRANVACRASHKLALTRLLETVAPAALILEDDVALASDTRELLHATDWWPEGTKAVRLEVNPFGSEYFGARLGETPSGRDIHRLHGTASGAAAYLIDRNGARSILATAPHNLHFDMGLFNLRTSKLARRFGTVQINPGMARQRLYTDSDNPPAPRKRRPRKSLCYRARLRGLRALGLVRRLNIAYQDAPAGRG